MWMPFVIDMLIVDWPCCYVVFSGPDVLYVGQTLNLKKRMRQHGFRTGHDGMARTPWGNFPDVHIKANFGLKYGDWAMREARLIRRLQPRYNMAGIRRSA